MDRCWAKQKEETEKLDAAAMPEDAEPIKFIGKTTATIVDMALSLAIQEGKWIHRLLCEIMTAANEDGPSS